MTNPDYTHITIVVDRSGSMFPVAEDAQGAVNAYIDSQRTEPGQCSLLLAEFDDQHNTVYEGPIADAPTYRLEPRGNTALYDAVGRAINTTGDNLRAMPEDARPAHVLFVIQTDGQENSSREWRLTVLEQRIATQRDQYGWQFVYLGTSAEAWAGGFAMGIDHNTRSAPTAQGYGQTYSLLGQTTSAMRRGKVTSAAAMSATIDEHGNITPDPQPEP